MGLIWDLFTQERIGGNKKPPGWEVNTLKLLSPDYWEEFGE
jgi:hypothetical protein